MLWILHPQPGFHQIRHEITATGRSARTTARFRQALTALRTLSEAIQECLAAHRQYEQMRSRGIPHETALREALGLGRTRSKATREGAKPLYFAGNS
jgi:hypothetical protein